MSPPGSTVPQRAGAAPPAYTAGVLEAAHVRPAEEWYWGGLLALLSGQLVAVVLLVRYAGGRVPLTYGLPALAGRLVLPMLAALVLRVILRLLAGDSLRWALRKVLEGWSDLPLVVVAYLLLAEAYMWGKLFVPAINPRSWDAVLAAADRRLCLGVNPNVALVTIFSGNPAWVGRALDGFYGAFVPLMLGTTAWFVTDTPARRKGFLAATAVLWSLGLWLYLAVPARGPVYVDAGLWREVAAVFPTAASMQMQLLQNFQAVQAFLRGAVVPVSPALGIAAMPSLHVAAQALFFLWCRRLESQWRTVFLASTALTFLGAVATGWHWAVDGWVGILLAVAAARSGWAVARSFQG